MVRCAATAYKHATILGPLLGNGYARNNRINVGSCVFYKVRADVVMGPRDSVPRITVPAWASNNETVSQPSPRRRGGPISQTPTCLGGRK
jgi:hypothetical protein